MMSYVYLLLEFGSISIPLIYSIVYRTEPFIFLKEFAWSTTLMAAIFIFWDVIFTAKGIWGFNLMYTMDIEWFGMPMEEWLFFFTIPYASLFIHFALDHYNKNHMLKPKQGKLFSLGLIGLISMVLSMNLDKSYTLFAAISCLVVLVLGAIKYPEMLNRFYTSFLLILIPFFLVNGVLTGSFIEGEVVWYNDEENLGLRLFTIPVEDIGYAFSLLFGNLLIYRFLKDLKDVPVSQ